MFDCHCHFVTDNAVCFSAELLPDRIELPVQYELISSSEAGLDARYNDRIPMEKQVKILCGILEYAKKEAIPVSLHCVRATGLMLDVIRKTGFEEGMLMWHGFTGSKETASELGKLGVIVSIGPRYHGDVKALFEANGRLVLESDYEGTSRAEHEQIMIKHYKRCAAELEMSIEELEEHCRETAKAFTDYKTAGTGKN